MGTATPDMPVAATGFMWLPKYRATNAFAFDLQAACSSFFVWNVASAYVQSGKYKRFY
jgi:3-oxoacyl-[acyl-carrier-protein] synthase-3